VSAAIRAAAAGDLPAIAAIHAHYALNTVATFDIDPLGEAKWREQWDADVAMNRPWLVTEEEGEVLGYVTTSNFGPKAAYDSTVETSIYMRPGAVGRGLGRPMYAEALAELGRRGFHAAAAGITLPNPSSVTLHEALGFEPVGIFREIGNKQDAWRDVGWWQKLL
jgi:L-amino acid N-acyltransferase YncA